MGDVLNTLPHWDGFWTLLQRTTFENCKIYRDAETCSQVSISLLSLVGLAYCYPTFQQRIPNGEVVPHPCNPNYVWEGVGHESRGGGGKRNVFGQDFHNNGKVWDRTLCMMDSDGDGMTNGQELGDPDCTWTPGTSPQRSAGLSHPGICEPIDAPGCAAQASFVVCEEMSFECDALSDPDVFNFTVRFPETPVPAEETTYMCMIKEWPRTSDYHMVGNMPLIDNINIMHHIVVYGCMDPGADVTVPEQDKPFECFMSGEAYCQDMIGLWAVGVNGQCFHPDAGFLVGNNPSGYRYVMLEFHWNNPTFTPGWTDSSGMTFMLSEKKRPYNAGILTIGQSHLEIPPGENRYTVTGSVSSTCTRERLTGPINIFESVNHMHYLGRAAESSIVRNNRATYLAYDPEYHYDRPEMHTHNPPHVLNPGDELQINCHFKSTARTTTTYYGEDTSAEMCFAFLMFYPRENIQQASLSSYMEFDPCDFGSPMIGGCNLTKHYDLSHPETIANYMAVLENCNVGSCRKECKPIVKRLKEHPCFSGSLKKIQLLGIEQIEDMQQRFNTMKFWALFDSCNEEFLKDRYAFLLDEDTSGGHVTSYSETAVLFCFIMSLLLLKV